MRLGVIGGTGALTLFEARRDVSMTTPFGSPSGRPQRIGLGDREFWFVPRHGDPHRIPPHRVNYRANIHALKTLEVDSIVAINAVGGITPEFGPGVLAVPDQLIDYTWGRAHTFSDGGSAPLRHIDFTHPFGGPLREALLATCNRAGADVIDGGCLGVVQGPRLETAAEVRRIGTAGCDMVGMTAMPEAALAREAGLDYASLCVVANAGAGLEDEPISEERIYAVLEDSMKRVRAILTALVERVCE